MKWEGKENAVNLYVGHIWFVNGKLGNCTGSTGQKL